MSSLGRQEKRLCFHWGGRRGGYVFTGAAGEEVVFIGAAGEEVMSSLESLERTLYLVRGLGRTSCPTVIAIGVRVLCGNSKQLFDRNGCNCAVRT